MYILQISDLHISGMMNPEDLRDKIHLLRTKIGEIIPKGSNLVCCVLGDVVDQGAAALYPKAESILNDLLNQLKEIAGADKLVCYLIPGNHDLCADKDGALSLDEFNKFASSIMQTDTVFTDTDGQPPKMYIKIELVLCRFEDSLWSRRPVAQSAMRA